MNSWTQRNSLLVMHLIVIILGLTGILGKLIEASSTILVWYRMLIAFVALGLYLLLQKKLFKNSERIHLEIIWRWCNCSSSLVVLL